MDEIEVGMQVKTNVDLPGVRREELVPSENVLTVSGVRGRGLETTCDLDWPNGQLALSRVGTGYFELLGFPEEMEDKFDRMGIAELLVCLGDRLVSINQASDIYSPDGGHWTATIIKEYKERADLLTSSKYESIGEALRQCCRFAEPLSEISSVSR